MNIEITVIVCTFNRSSFLERFLDSVLRLNVNEELQWELLIVDNNSNDNTHTLVEKYQDQISNLHYVFEKKQGKGYALNTGINQAKGNTVIFTDDDVTLDTNWLTEYACAFNQHPQYQWFGGVVQPKWIDGEPHWLNTPESRAYFKGYFVWYQIAAQSRPYQDNDSYPYGASMAIRKSLFDAIGYFREDIGVKGKIRGAGMDIDIIQRARNSGFEGYYVSTAICRHYLDQHRLRLTSFVSYGFGRGINHYKIEVDKKRGSIIRAVSQLLRGLLQLVKGRHDRFRITLINVGMEIGRVSAHISSNHKT